MFSPRRNQIIPTAQNEFVFASIGRWVLASSAHTVGAAFVKRYLGRTRHEIRQHTGGPSRMTMNLSRIILHLVHEKDLVTGAKEELRGVVVSDDCTKG